MYKLYICSWNVDLLYKQISKFVLDRDVNTSTSQELFHKLCLQLCSQWLSFQKSLKVFNTQQNSLDYHSSVSETSPCALLAQIKHWLLPFTAYFNAHHQHHHLSVCLHLLYCRIGIHTFLIMGSSVVVTLWKILFTPAKGTSFFVVTRS